MSSYETTHSMGVKCSRCGETLVADSCKCGQPHGWSLQMPSEWSAEAWPDHPCLVPKGDE